LFFTSLSSLVKNSFSLREFSWNDKSNELYVEKIHKLLNDVESEKDVSKIRSYLSKIQLSLDQIRVPADQKLHFKVKNLPEEIRFETFADIEELEKCFDANCYRSAVIICGRILETALHRKYFEIAGNDLLEKSPGIGLGNLIAKMAEKNIKLDPGLPNQIHLINQVRVFAVHKKQEAFYPSKAQTHAIILYTLDVVEKLFS